MRFSIACILAFDLLMQGCGASCFAFSSSSSDPDELGCSDHLFLAFRTRLSDVRLITSASSMFSSLFLITRSIISSPDPSESELSMICLPALRKALTLERALLTLAADDVLRFSGYPFFLVRPFFC